ncbi:transaldolase [Streptomyces niger]|uniref:transaldolase n=1 Tax=Streptomyces niger TaxID=66373 RepID=UPI000A6E8723|nr:transaldolase [Streptomyces niger]
MTASRLQRLNDAGVSFWLDGVSRFLLRSGALAALVRDWRVSGVTTNPALFRQAVAAGHSYTAQLRTLAARGATVGEAVWKLAGHDLRWVCDVLLPLHLAHYGSTGLVSVDIDPRLADDAATTVERARRLWREIDRPNLLIKIPATDPGLQAISDCLAEGIGVNATSVFSAERYQQVADAHLAGLELAARAGRPLADLHCIASFQVNPIDRAVDPLLDEIGTEAARDLRGKAALTVARLVLARHRRTYEGAAWQRFARLGARRQQLLWAATTVHDPVYRDTHYADGLFVPGTASAMPEQLLWAVADHGGIQRVREEETESEAMRTLGSLTGLGIGLDDITRRLEGDARKASTATWHQLLDAVATSLDEARV